MDEILYTLETMTMLMDMGCPKNHKYMLVGTLLIISIFSIKPPVAAQAGIHGIVQDESFNPIAGAKVAVWRDDSVLAELETDSDGRFQFDVEGQVIVTVYMDIKNTPGMDYLPAFTNFTGGYYLEFTLSPAASISIEGDIQYVESEELPLSVYYAVQDESGNTVEPSGYPLIYGSEQGYRPYASRYLKEEGKLIIPAESPGNIVVNSSLIVESNVKTRSIVIEQPSISQGSVSTLNIKRYVVPDNLDIVNDVRGEVEARMDEMEELGFFLQRQREMAASGTRWLVRAGQLYEEDAYIESYDAAKRGYIDFHNVRNELGSMFRDASYSVYILLGFMALTSITIAQLLTSSLVTKLTGSVAINAVSIMALYYIYPGSTIIPFNNYIGYSIIFFAVSMALSLLVPRIMKGRGSRGHLPVRNIVVPIFSIAKRSLKRRRLRFFLTLSSITVLVMSFVALTSFSEGYGLLLNRVSSQRITRNGILIRDSAWKQGARSFIPYRELESGWLNNQPETVVASPKAENLPQERRIATLNGHPLMGVLGIDPKLEQDVIDIESTIVEGSLHSDNGVLISESLQETLDVEIGDKLSLLFEELTLEGVFSDEEFRRLMEIDGSDYLPKKLVNANPEGEVPNLVEETCEPSEVAVIHISKSRKMIFIGISRIRILTHTDTDLIQYAERLALERGFKAWASTPDGIFLAQLGSYLQGKGLPLLIPWVIVVLNVVITMLNSLYERRREISILSSVGLNPAQIAAIFVAEASIIGLIAGGGGYLGGLSLYKIMAFTGVSLEVHQKVSAFWSMASICLAISAVLTGAFAALKNSVVITPSLMRKWRIDRTRARYNEPWEMEIPVKILPEEKEEFIYYTLDYLEALQNDPIKSTALIKLVEDDTGEEIEFVYRATQSTSTNFYTRNTIVIHPRGGIYSVYLYSVGEQSWVHETGSLVRMMAMEWSTGKS